jgi:AcrR family transcriptional regulator
VKDQASVVTRRGETYGGRSRAERATERRDRIVAAAVQLFGTQDYETVTVADVCASAKVSKRYFYEHFADRVGLIVAVHREQNEWLLNGVVQAVPERPATLEELLRPAMRTLIGLLRAYPERARVIYINAPRMETRRREVLRKDAEFLGRFLRRASGRPVEKVRVRPYAAGHGRRGQRGDHRLGVPGHDRRPGPAGRAPHRHRPRAPERELARVSAS